MKRFYQTVTCVTVPLDDQNPVYQGQTEGFGLKLDDRLLKSPDKKPFCLPNQAMAEAIAAEWDQQSEKIQPETMPVMGQAAKTVDWISQKYDIAIDEIMEYAETDLLCYRVSYPENLAQRQRAAWQPILEWIATTYHAPLTVTDNVQAVAQPPESLAHLNKTMRALSPWALAAIHSLTGVLGSACLTLALYQQRISAQQAFEASFLDELFQVENWGEDQEAKQHRDRKLQEISDLALYLSYVTPPVS